MPRGLNRTGNFSSGTPITLPHEFGNPVTLPKDFGNKVTWTPDPAHFGNVIGGGPTPPPPAPAPTFVQQQMAFDGSSSGQTTDIVFSAPATAGNSLTVFVTVQNSKTLTSISDTALNTYTLVRGPDVVVGAGGTANTYVYKCAVVSGAPTTITLHTGSPINQGPTLACVVETTAGTVDTTVSNTATFTTGADIDGGAVVASASDLLLLFAFYANGGGSPQFQAGTGWTLVGQLRDTSFIGECLGLERQTVSAGSTEAFVKISASAGNGIITTVALKG